ncbi:DUF6115 domain-containing protein [Aquibacillus kalidii]|uniref:DUF6115 domain-containing protein n=1 Tax=Aquibacillus kalidii TaxID=2762597 RepID=UPI001646667E|nr:hypothetical protein [Aquibacillus kalidii]
MVIILLLVSFLLHILAFTLIRTMKEKVQNFEEIDRKQKQNIKEMEDLLAVYLLEIREENDKFIDSIQQGTPLYPNHSQQKDTSIESARPVMDKKQNNAEQYPIPQQKDKVKKNVEYVPPLENMEQDTVEQSQSGKVFALFDQGESPEAIAKKLGLGRTEVELLLKFHRKNS